MLRSREVLKGCQIGKLTQDPDIAADVDLRRPIDETFEWLQLRIKSILEEGQQNGEISTELNATEVAATLISVIQGGYVLASAAALLSHSRDPRCSQLITMKLTAQSVTDTLGLGRSAGVPGTWRHALACSLLW